MRFSTLAAAAIVASPSLVSAAPGTLGFSLGTKKPDGSCKFSADYEEDFDAIAAASGSKLVRGYSASDCNTAQEILPAAQKKGFQVMLGIWPDVQESFDADTAALKQSVPQYPDQVHAITVGSETLYRGNFTGEQLLSKIRQVKQMFPNTKVGTADSWNKFADGTANAVIQGGVDILLVNAFAYWQAQPIKNATATYFDDIMQAFTVIQKVAGSTNSIELWNGETGWPSDGASDYSADGHTAVAGTQNARAYFQQAVCGLLTWGFNVFFFEAFDEPWKPVSIGDNGEPKDETHWGGMTADRQAKYPLRC